MMSLRQLAAFVSRWELVAIAILAPLFILPPIGRAILVLTLLLPCVWLIEWMGGVEPVPMTPINGSLALLLMMVLVSTTATYNILFSAAKVLGVVFGVAAFFAVVKVIRQGLALDRAFDLFAVAGAGLAIVGLLGTNWIDKIPALSSLTAHLPAVIRGVPGQVEGFHPNGVAGMLVMFIPVQFALTFASRRRAWHAALFLISLFTLLLTQSRGGYLSLIGAAILWFLWGGSRWRARTIAAALAVIAVAMLFQHQMMGLLSESIWRGIASSDVPSRLELWSRAVRIIEDFPLTGIGMNTFRRLMPARYPAFLTRPDFDVAHAHNQFLQSALDLGLPGLIAYLAIWFGLAALLVRVYRRCGNSSRRLIASGMSAGMLAYFFFGVADAVALGAKAGIFFWIALALVVSMNGELETAA